MLVTGLRWVGPKLANYLEDWRLKRQIAGQINWARELGYEDSQFHFEMEDGKVRI